MTLLTTTQPDEQYIIIIAVGIACTIIGGIAGYIQGRSAARMESDRFWLMQKKIKAYAAPSKADRRSAASVKGHKTRDRRKRNKVATIVNGTECSR